VEPVPTKRLPFLSLDWKRLGDVARNGKYISTKEAESRKANPCLKKLILKKVSTINLWQIEVTKRILGDNDFVVGKTGVCIVDVRLELSEALAVPMLQKMSKWREKPWVQSLTMLM
jgi:hypothetical protein